MVYRDTPCNLELNPEEQETTKTSCEGNWLINLGCIFTMEYHEGNKNFIVEE